MGLAGAYFVDDSGEYAGIGIPSKNGWDWPLLEGTGAKIKQLVNISEGKGELNLFSYQQKLENYKKLINHASFKTIYNNSNNKFML